MRKILMFSGVLFIGIFVFSLMSGSGVNEYSSVIYADAIIESPKIEKAFLESDLVIKVKLTDELSESNSRYLTDETGQNHSYYSIRNADVVEVISGEYSQDKIEFYDPYAIVDDVFYTLQHEGEKPLPLEMGEVYTLFLVDQSESGHGYGIQFAGNGAVAESDLIEQRNIEFSDKSKIVTSSNKINDVKFLNELDSVVKVDNKNKSCDQLLCFEYDLDNNETTITVENNSYVMKGEIKGLN